MTGMPVSKAEALNNAGLSSPVEERHIDYILEEEFSVNPEFLRVFVDLALDSAVDKSRIERCTDSGTCSAVRSATTAKGETDLLVKYGGDADALPTAILIEDKIRAGFQPDQAQRYHERGREGLGQQWSRYWTCLVAHPKYSAEQGDFDAIVTLDALQRYFAKKTDERSLFRARVLEQTINKFETTGVQRIDLGMTRFRAMYAAECEAALGSQQWLYDKPRDAWWDDNWFFFRRASWPKAVQIRHQARAGNVDLILPVPDRTSLDEVMKERAAHNPGAIVPLEVVAVGNNKFAFRITVLRIGSFPEDLEPPNFEDFFEAVKFLAKLYESHSGHLPAQIRPGVHEVTLSEEDRELQALRAMLLGFMRSTVTSLGTQMPYPLPDLRRLTASTPQQERYFASPGLMGGFLLEPREDDSHAKHIISEHWSRQWGGTVRHRITPFEIVLLAEEAF